MEKLTNVLNETYDTGEIPEDLTKSIVIALPKKPGAIECELHRTISLMNHITKILLRIIVLRTRSRIRPEIGKEQCGFMQDTGTRNAIFMVLRVISESDSNAGRHLHVLHQLYKSLRQSETYRIIQII